MSEFYSYILTCSDGSLYCGYTVDPQRRLEAHNAGRGARYTRSRRPVKLAALWQWRNRHEAMAAEWLAKRFTRQQKLFIIEFPGLLYELAEEIRLSRVAPMDGGAWLSGKMVSRRRGAAL